MVVLSPQVPFGADFVQTATAFCPAGYRAISGGGVSVSDEEIAASLAAAGRTGWAVIGVDTVDSGGEYVKAQASCAPINQAVAAGTTSRDEARRQVARLAAEVRAQHKP